MGIPMGVGSFLVFRALYTTDLAYARTMTLQVMAMYQWFNAWNCRSEHTSLFKLGFFANRWLILATSLVLGLQMIILYVPFMRELFKTVPLSFCDWAFVVLVTAPIILLEEVRKWLAHRYGQSFALTNLLKKLRYTKEE
jgi:Ca2+-transporting ATPase